MKVVTDIFQNIVSLENLFSAWSSFQKGKMEKRDVAQFAWRLEENMFALQRTLRSGRYRHSRYSGFHIRDPKPRHIHKATVRDRIVHHAVFNILNPIFEPTFIANSFSCRVEKGTHKGVAALASMLRKVSCNATRQCFALKCDVRQFFASIDQAILISLIRKKIKNAQALRLVEEIIGSYRAGGTERERE